eukprot:COSAG05_NODE_10804_length_545_cov_1.421525_1_plen_27_part_10
MVDMAAMADGIAGGTGGPAGAKKSAID